MGPSPYGSQIFAMGNYAILVVLAGAVTVSLFLHGTREGTSRADVNLANHAFKSVIAREAAATGLNLTVRRLVADTARWSVNPTLYEYDDEPFKNATFTTDVQPNYLPGPRMDFCWIDTVDVISTAIPDADSSGFRSHRVEATYVRTCSDGVAGGSSGLGFGTIADKQFSINGETAIHSSDPEENADIHTNQNLYVNGNPQVEGFGTYVSSTGNLCDTCNGFLPNDDVNGAAANVYQSEYVDIPTLSAAQFLPDATHIHIGNFDVNRAMTIDFTNYKGKTGFGTKENPYVWYITGSLNINSDTFTTLGYVKIVVLGALKVNSSARILSSANASAPPPPPSTYDNRNKNAMRSWIDQYHTQGTSGIYVFGTIDNKLDKPAIHFNGNNVVAGSIYSIGSVLINGDTTVIGTITTKDAMHYNGKNVLWYVGGHESIEELGGGGESTMPDGIRLLSYVEW